MQNLWIDNIAIMTRLLNSTTPLHHKLVASGRLTVDNLANYHLNLNDMWTPGQFRPISGEDELACRAPIVPVALPDLPPDKGYTADDDLVPQSHRLPHSPIGPSVVGPTARPGRRAVATEVECADG